jgi:hypothetical protein
MRKRNNRFNTCIPGYNWCGPFCSGPAAPINEIDRCCKMHDKCYKFRGYDSCSCNRDFRKCLRPHINHITREGRTAAMMYNFISSLPCVQLFIK